jgi:hypothetical protein
MAAAAAVLLAGGAAWGQTAPAANPERLDTQFAHELSRLKQIDLMKDQEAAAAGTPAENLWKAQLLLAQYDELIKAPGADAAKIGQDYLAAITAYVQANPKALDGGWALDHAQFILSRLSQPYLTRMEYFANNRRDRLALAPLAALADQLLRAGGDNLAASLKALEAAKPFDDKTYALRFSAAAEVRYYSAWALYFRAMSLDPAGGEGADRRKLLTQAVEALNEWAVDDSDNGVNFQAYLLRAKAENESGDLPRAQADFAKAQNDKAPNWVQYQSRYQMVVAFLRAGDLRQAQTTLDAFKRWIPRDNPEAGISADMLAYRVAWALAETRTDAAERRWGEHAALDILSGVIQRDPRYRDLVSDQLAAQIPDAMELNALMPIQLLAVARSITQAEDGKAPESQQRLTRGLAAAQAVIDDTTVPRPDRLEAIFLAGVTSALLNNPATAARYNVQFAELAPQDPRAAQMVNLALQQIGEIRKAATQAGKPLPPEMSALTGKALGLAIDTYGQKQWLFARARILEDEGKIDQAAAIYAAIPQDDRNYLDSRYRLVTIAADRFSQLAAKKEATEADVKKAAADLFDACGKFVGLLDHPPESAPREVLAAAQNGGYRYNIWFIEAAAALHPLVKQADVAIDRLEKLEAAKKQLSAAQQTSLLRYRILAYQLAGQSDKAMQVIGEFMASAGTNNADALNVLHGMVLSTIDEIDKVESTNPAQAKQLAGNVVQLLNPIIKQADAAAAAPDADAARKDEAFEYHLVRADMMVRAGQYAEAQQAALDLQKDRPPDIRPFLTEARGLFGEAQAKNDPRLFAKSQDYFRRILERMAPGGEGFWECWLRMLQSMEAQGTANAAEIKSRLGDLKGVYGSAFGGTRRKEDFAQMAAKYGV